MSKEQEVCEADKGNSETAPSNASQESEECVMDSSSEHLLSRQEVIRRLRERGEPILLFGESHIEAFKRLRKCEILEPEVNKVTYHSPAINRNAKYILPLGSKITISSWYILVHLVWPTNCQKMH